MTNTESSFLPSVTKPRAPPASRTKRKNQTTFLFFSEYSGRLIDRITLGFAPARPAAAGKRPAVTTRSPGSTPLSTTTRSRPYSSPRRHLAAHDTAVAGHDPDVGAAFGRSDRSADTGSDTASGTGSALCMVIVHDMPGRDADNAPDRYWSGDSDTGNPDASDEVLA